MKLIAESGSTKTNWKAFDQSQEYEVFQTIGLNPYFIQHKNMDEALQQLPFDLNEIQEVYFYGAGCASEEKCLWIANAIKQHIPQAKVEVHSDLLAAARALFGHQKGIVGILGTGSNAAIYNGTTFTEKVNSLGYVLGDEGSGNHIGRSLVQAYFRGELSKDIEHKLSSSFDVELSSVLHAIYKEDFPNRYLAKFASFASENKSDSKIRELLIQCFREFFQYQVMKFNKPNYQIGLIGSIAFYFQDIIQEIANQNGLEIRHILQDPLPKLVEFHR